MKYEPEYFSFTTHGRAARRYPQTKAILVTMRNRPEGLQVISILSITLTTIKMLGYSGAPWRDPDKLPHHVRTMVQEFDDLELGKIMRRIWKEDEDIFSPHVGRIQ